ncbi:MAG: peptide chain release factor N(5)-glutamine methyltransferase [Lentisphaeria bacterium]|nr:peptide chain release factor N(5)-glutamine methyltransferase [Lentisphaeria bacterium]
MTYRQLSLQVTSMLEAAEIENFEVEAENLILDVLDISRTDFSIKKLSSEEVAKEEFDRVIKAAEKRAQHIPLQHITSRAYFRNLVLRVNPDVLIPRFETEILVDEALKNLPVNGRLLDVGTGSGAIAISCASERRDISVTAVDISRPALETAEKNAELCNVDNITFKLSDLVSAVGENEKFDVVTANLPYVTNEEYETLQREVKEHEPRLALTAEEDGLQLINRLCDELNRLLAQQGYAILEMSPHQTQEVKNRLEKLGFSAGIINDYTGRARFVWAKKA